MDEKHNSTKTNSETNSEHFAQWLVLLMGEAILQQQFRNNAYSPTKEAKRAVLKLWTMKAAEMGRPRFTAGLWNAFLHTSFIPSCEDIEQWAPEEESRDQMYCAYQLPEPAVDPVTQEQLDKFNSLVRDIAEGKVMAKREPKDRQELHEKISKGMKAQIIDRKAEAANDK